MSSWAQAVRRAKRHECPTATTIFIYRCVRGIPVAPTINKNKTADAVLFLFTVGITAIGLALFLFIKRIYLHCSAIISDICCSIANWRADPCAHGSQSRRICPGRHTNLTSLQEPFIRVVIFSFTYCVTISRYFWGMLAALYAHICETALFTLCTHGSVFVMRITFLTVPDVDWSARLRAISVHVIIPMHSTKTNASNI